MRYESVNRSWRPAFVNTASDSLVSLDLTVVRSSLRFAHHCLSAEYGKAPLSHHLHCLAPASVKAYRELVVLRVFASEPNCPCRA